MSKEHFEQQLRGIIDKHVYSIRYVDDNSMHLSIETPLLTIINTLKNWCYCNDNQNKGKMKGLVIYGYSLDKHLKFLRFESILENDLFSVNTEELLEESEELIIAYNPAEKVILLIRKASINN